MNLFLILCILGIGLILLGKTAIRVNKTALEANKTNNFKVFDISILWGKINIKYGKLLLITGMLGVFFYDKLGLLMVVIMILVLISYIANLFISGYKFLIHT